MAVGTQGRIVITFTRSAVDGEYLTFDRINDGLIASTALLTTFTDAPRATNGVIQIQTPTATLGEVEAIAYERYFDIDHNASGLMTLTRNVNVITIDISLPWYFDNYVTTVGATELKAEPIPDTFYIVSTSWQVHPTDPCNFVDLDITTSEIPDSIAINGLESSVGAATFTISIARTVPTEILVLKSTTTINVSLDQIDKTTYYFNKLYDDTVYINIIPNQFSGATVGIHVNYINQLSPKPDIDVLTYSLDDVTYQTSNIFSGQANGDYTIYIKDSFGCTYSKDYTVLGSGSRDEFFYVSDVNSVTFSKDEVWDGLQNGIHKNEENVLSLTDYGKTLYEEKLIYRNEDEIRIQFKSNYGTHVIHLQDCEGNDVALTPTVEKMSNNMDLFESLDCTLYNFGNGKAGLYFTTGNIYNEVGADIGNYELNGNLPDSAIVGTFINIVGHGIFEIADLFYDARVDKRVMVFNYSYTGATDDTIIMKAYYDLLNFEVYEFNVDFSPIIIHGGLDREIRIRIQATDDLFTEINYYSEYISLLEDYTNGMDKYVSINYKNENNRDIFYLYGITHFIRAEILRTFALIDDSSEIIKGDNTTYLAESTVHKGIGIVFSEVTYRMMLKLTLALSSETLFINGLGYIKKDNISVSPVDNTNLYEVSCELLSTNANFNTFIESNTGESEGYETTYIPKLILGDAGLLKT